ncbi:PAS domain S-box protein [Rapidithrix thailandica]|uniref:histidine kinase n=1 Tax=Rapidithrix thailandica TaxID=413964 RepID=A0AAW9RTG0_9BACT
MDQVLDFFSKLIQTEDFPARWVCGKWSDVHGWLYILSNIAIWLAYFTIPVILLYVVSKRQNLPFRKIFLLFTLFILFCGSTHFLDALIFWKPVYRLNAVFLFLTAVVSWITVFATIKILPKTLQLKSPQELETINHQLRQTLKEKKLVDQQFYWAFEYSPVGMAHVGLDGHFLRVNKVLCQITGYTKEELLKTNFQAITYKADTQMGVDHMKKLKKGVIESAQFEKRYVHKEGHTIWAILNTSIVKNENGEPLFLVSQVQDISQRKNAELALKKSEERFRLVFEGAQAGIWDWVDVQKDQEWWSPKFYQLLGYQDREIEASVENFRQLLHPEDLAPTFDLVREHFTHQQAFIIEYRLKTKTGAYKWFLGSGQAQFDTNGQPVRMVGSIIDIDEKKQAEKQLLEKQRKLEVSNRDLASFSYSVSHDLKAPLRSINGYCEILLEDYLDKLDANGQHSINVIVKNAQKMGTLIDDILAYSKVSQQTLTVRTLNMRQIFENVFFELTYGTDRDIEFNVGELKHTQGDQTMVTQLVNNILSNAIKYTSTRSRATIEVQGIETQWGYTYRVKDNGVGFENAFVHKIFGVFERLHKDHEFEGTGVGLAIAKRTVESHGGKIWADSKLNQGTNIYFTLNPTVNHHL